MTLRRECKPVEISDSQRARLEDIWFVYGNHGPKTTPGNHTFIQTVLEHGLDLRPLRTRRTPKSEIPTPECEAAVDRILGDPEGHSQAATRTSERPLCLVPPPSDPRPRLRPDPELKALIDDMRRRQFKGREPQAASQDDAPDAA